MYRLRAAACCAALMMSGCGGGSSSDAPAQYTVGGRVTGLTGTVILENNGASPLSLATTGAFTFAASVTGGGAYSVTVSTQPTGQTCTVTNGSGTVASANVTAVAVACVANSFSVGGTITGLAVSGLVLADSGQTVSPAVNAASFVFPTQIPYGTSYSVKVETQPAGQTCVVTNGVGTVTTANITNVQIACTYVSLTAVPAPAAAPTCIASCLYVDAVNGLDTNAGTTPSTPLQTLNKASSLVIPGSIVLINSGTYTSDGTTAPLTISTSGTSKAFIEFAAAVGQHPIIQIPNGSGAYAGIHVLGASYIIINGIEVIGQNQSITAQQAAANDGTQALLNENCLFVDGAFAGITSPYPPEPHNIVITNSSFHDCSAAGILVEVADSLTIAYNQVYNNGWWTVDGSSGIDIYHLTAVNVTGSASLTYNNIIVGNLIYDNYNTLPTAGSQPSGIYDGNGLILDDSQHTQAALGPYDIQGDAYLARSYVVNNIAHDNGGRGLHSLNSAHIDIVNNTTYNNLTTSSPYIVCCEIDGASSQDVNVVNNIGIDPHGGAVDENDGNQYKFNIWNGANPYLGANDLATAAGLTSPSTENFAPATGSPALASGTNALAPTLDFSGTVRTSAKIDRGAIQVTP